MKLIAIKDLPPTHYRPEVIQPQLIVIHATGCNLDTTHEIFCSSDGTASSHLVIDIDGKIYEYVQWQEIPWIAHHAGKSVFDTPQGGLFSLNSYSIGIELVNLGCQWMTYPMAQYQALAEVIKLIWKFHPATKNAYQIVGHEEIAGYRGKLDPGLAFDWALIGKLLGIEQWKNKKTILKLPAEVAKLCEQVKVKKMTHDEYPQISSLIEAETAKAVKAGESILNNQAKQLELARKFYPDDFGNS